MTGAKQTLKLCNKRPQSSSPSSSSTPPPIPVIHWFPVKRGTGDGSKSRGQKACLPQQGATEGETDCRERERQLFPPTHSEPLSHTVVPTTIAMETTGRPRAAGGEREFFYIHTHVTATGGW
ncbi:hypothetical protein ILYODFUR_008254 [Ilyodon furcidens]|uniref:Uncharacterized protein n=1 Tax=Ilyodon furcidens TaxID=33524 RepID=A0ABV0TKX3_9TELE